MQLAFASHAEIVKLTDNAIRADRYADGRRKIVNKQLKSSGQEITDTDLDRHMDAFLAARDALDEAKLASKALRTVNKHEQQALQGQLQIAGEFARSKAAGTWVCT